jgi:hypothetical protein
MNPPRDEIIVRVDNSKDSYLSWKKCLSLSSFRSQAHAIKEMNEPLGLLWVHVRAKRGRRKRTSSHRFANSDWKIGGHSTFDHVTLHA